MAKGEDIDYFQMNEVSHRISLETPEKFQLVFEAGLEYLNQEYPLFLTHVLNIGAPEWVASDEQVPTAAVSAMAASNSDKRGKFTFLFNQGFAESLSPSTMGFVAAHETMHILLNHLRLAQKFDDAERFNLAADAVINDYLSDKGLDLPEGVVTGQDLIGQDCMFMTVGQVYRQLENQATAKSEGEKDINDSFASFDDHKWMQEASHTDMASAENEYRKVESSLPAGMKELKEKEDAM